MNSGIFLEEREKDLKKIRSEVLECRKCPLHKRRTYPVIGEGNHSSGIIFIGEAPGFQEDRTARPFCGSAGKILDGLLESAGIKREEVYITNIVKCRPPRNRDPQIEEIMACFPYLKRQIGLIKPKVICPLGRYSMQFLMEEFGFEDEVRPISRLHGRTFKKEFSRGPIVIPFYHPAVAIYHSSMKAVLEKDFETLKQFKK